MSALSRRRFMALSTTTLALLGACNGKPSSLQSDRGSTAQPNQATNPPTRSRATTPTRIVALEWVYVEDLLALGMQPVGVADIQGYQKFVNIQPQLAQQVVEVGTRQEPSLETIAQLEPDLILGAAFRHQAILNTLQSIAPTQLFNPYPEPDQGNQLVEMEQTFRQIAATVDRTEQGETVLQTMRATFNRAQQALQAATQLDRPFVLGQFLEGAPQLRLFTDNALAAQVLMSLGLKNAWSGKLDPFGFNTVWLEALPAIEQAKFLYVAQPSDASFQQLQRNPVWQGLNFVQQNRFFALGGDTWLFGGPLSAQLLSETVVNALT